MPWCYDYFETYRLRQGDLDDFLTELFDNYDFLITVSDRIWLKSQIKLKVN